MLIPSLYIFFYKSLIEHKLSESLELNFRQHTRTCNELTFPCHQSYALCVNI